MAPGSKGYGGSNRHLPLGIKRINQTLGRIRCYQCMGTAPQRQPVCNLGQRRKIQLVSLQLIFLFCLIFIANMNQGQITARPMNTVLCNKVQAFGVELESIGQLSATKPP